MRKPLTLGELKQTEWASPARIGRTVKSELRENLICLLENGVHLSLVSLAPGLPETALFGVATEVVVTVFLLLYVIAGLYQQAGTTDTLRMRELHG